MSQFTQVDAALEEAQFLADTTGMPHSVFEVKGLMYVYLTSKIINTDSILETIKPRKEE